MPLKGERTFGGGIVQQLEVVDWSGADVLAMVGPAGERMELRRGGPSSVMVPPAGWRWDQFDLYAWSESGEAVGMPQLGVKTGCGPQEPSQEPQTWGYAASTRDLANLLEATHGLQLGSMVPGLAIDEHPSLRLRVERPLVFNGAPAQTRLRIDVAGIGTVDSFRLRPDVEADDLTMIDPASVTRWTFHWPTPVGTLTGTAETRPDALVLKVQMASLAGKADGQRQVATLTLPLESSL
jgi:hypothetical protein